jgi:hypothetical protein
MRHKLFSASCMVAIAVIGAAPAAYADANNHNNVCQNEAGTPGNAATSPGSVFNEPMINSASGGKGGQAYNTAGAPSQYDRACHVTSANGTATPQQQNTTPPTTDITNNARDTRAISHTGNGPK